MTIMVQITRPPNLALKFGEVKGIKHMAFLNNKVRFIHQCIHEKEKHKDN